VAFSTVLRWILEGVPGPGGGRVKLEGVRAGGRWLTSEEALEGWMDRLTPHLDHEPVPAPRSPTQRRRGSERAERELDRARI
jgi:hypothetical protein